MNQKLKWVCVTLIPIFLVFIFMPTSPRLVLRGHDGHILRHFPATETSFSLRFRHSVNQGMVEEDYTLDIKNRRMALTTAFFESYGAGMLDTLPEGATLSEEGDSLRVDFTPMWVPSVSYTAAGIAQQTLCYGEVALLLYDLAPMRAVVISVERFSPWRIATT